MNILVTGAAGFIGSHLVDVIKEQHEVFALVRDFNPSYYLQQMLKGAHIIQGDAGDRALIRRVLVDNEIDCVVHLAAQAIVKHAKETPADTIANNISAGLAVLEGARQAKTPHVIIQSTDKVYGNGLGMMSDAPVMPTEAYGTSKACVDLIAQTYADVYKMAIAITRPCNIYGYDTNNRIIPNTIRDCLAGKRPKIFKNENSVRQYAFIDDVVRVFVAMINGKVTGIVNIASDAVFSQEEVVNLIASFFPGLEPEYVEKPGLVEIKSQSITPSPFGFCQTPLHVGLEKTILQYDIKEFQSKGKWIGKQ